MLRFLPPLAQSLTALFLFAMPLSAWTGKSKPRPGPSHHQPRIEFSIKNNLLWIAGQELTIDWKGHAGAKFLDLDESDDGRHWSFVSRHSTSGDSGTILYTPPLRWANKTGHIRFRNDGSHHVIRRFRIRCLPPAGSPEAGPLLEYVSIWDGSLFRNDGSNPDSVVPALDFAQAIFRLGKNPGADSFPCLRRILDAGMDTADAYYHSSGVPVLVSRFHFHYVNGDGSGIFRREFQASAFPRDTVPFNKVLFVTGGELTCTNKPDSLVEIILQIGAETLHIPAGDTFSYAFDTTGQQEFRISSIFASGFVAENKVRLWVREMSPPEPLAALSSKVVGPRERLIKEDSASMPKMRSVPLPLPPAPNPLPAH